MKNKINLYFHCKNCLNLKKMKTKEKLAVGWTKKGLQVWCEGCNINVVALDFLGQKIDFDRD